jgi:prepilin-type N-terminal cleavage/methylation domain-containing protein
VTSTRNNEAGFSLVELLVSLSLLSLMAIYALNAFNVTSRMKAIARGVERQSEEAAVLRLLQDEVSTLVPVYRQDNTGSPILQFQGGRDSLSYVVTSDGTREVGGLYSVTWRVNDKRQLIVERHLLLPEGAASEPLVALDNVAALAFEYDGSLQNWTDQQLLPKSIDIKIVLDERSRTIPERTVVIAATP